MNKQFEEWVRVNYPNYYMTEFNGLPFIFQWGVYLEFFDSVGLDIGVFKATAGLNPWVSSVLETSGDLDEKHYSTRLEAQQEAIKKAFEILEK